MWSSSPLRRYVDMVNQRQIIAMLRDEEPAYHKNDPALYATMRDFDTMYGIYNEFQRSMERYWCLRWLQQEKIGQVNGHGGSPLPQIPSPQSSDGTTSETTSHPTKQPEDGCLVVGYSHSTKPASGQVAGYLPQAGEGANESLRELIVTATVLRENLVKLSDIPLIFRAPSLPELPANTRVQLAIGEIDLLDLEVQTRFVAKLEEVA
jgi:hypothetical protein